MKFLINFMNGLTEDLKAFVFWLGLLTLFRIIFMMKFAVQLPQGAYSDITACLWLGTRLSLKTAGWICALGFILTTLPGIFWQGMLQWKLRFHAAAILVSCVLFMARFPYYRAFEDAFNGMIITAFHEDWWAILCMIVDDYGVWWRIPVALILTDIFYFALKMFLWYVPLGNFAESSHKWLTVAATVIVLPLLAVFVRFGGAFTYRRGISWVSAARFASPLLNAATLDDGQAITRVVKIWRLRQKIDGINLDKSGIRSAVERLRGNLQAKTIDDAFGRRAEGQGLKRQPKKVVLVVAEGLGIWPFVEPFDKLHLADEVMSFRDSPMGTSIDMMLPAGPSTIAAVQSICTGTPFTGSRYNFEERIDSNNPMFLCNIMKRLGYKTVFWYSGFASWENLGNFASNVGFDEFHHCGEFDYKYGNSWGASDEDFYKAFLQSVNKDGDDKVFYMLLPGSNHPPYSIDVQDRGFPLGKVMKALPPALEDVDPKALGHLWYGDFCIGEVVRNMQQQFPDTLFVITGDHPVRNSFAKEQDLRIRSLVPFVVYGNGVSRDTLPRNGIGSHQQIPATLAELLGPKGFSYSSFLPGVCKADFVYNHELFVRDGVLQQIGKLPNREQRLFRDAGELGAQRLLKGNGEF